MKKIFIVFIFVFTTKTIFAQDLSSKTYCFKGYYISAEYVEPTQDSGLIVSGTIRDIKSNPFKNNDAFIAKINQSGTMTWFKKFPADGEFSTTKLISLSNNNYLLNITFNGNNPGILYSISTNGNLLWQIPDFNATSIIDMPSQNAFLQIRGNQQIYKYDYNGTMLWAKGFSLDSINLSTSVTLQKDNKILLATTSVNKEKCDTIHLFQLDANSGIMLKKSKIFSTSLSKLESLKILATDNRTVLISNDTGLLPHKALVFTIDYNLNLIETTNIQLSANKESSITNAVTISNNKIIFSISQGVAQNIILAVFDPVTNKFISSFVELPSNSLIYQDFKPFNYINGKFTYVHGRIGKMNIISNSNFYDASLCQNSIISYNTPKIVAKSNTKSSIYSIDYPLEQTKENISFGLNSVKYNQFNICPTCFCPDTIFSQIKICEGKKYKFTQNGKQIEIDKAGIYTDSTRNLSNCLSFNQIIVEVKPKSQSSVSKFICTTQQSIKIAQKTYSKEGTYTDTLKTSTGCDSILNITIKSLTDFKVSLGEDKEILQGDEITLNAQSDYANIIKKYTWLPAGTSSCDTCKSISITPDKNQWFAVQASVEGCTAIDSINIKVLSENLVFIPNAFSPNNDQVNDVFRPFTADTVVEIEHFSVYDRWGNLLYEATNSIPNDPKIGWDGTFRGSNVSEDIYIYTAKIRLKNGKIQKFAGDVKLFR